MSRRCEQGASLREYIATRTEDGCCRLGIMSKDHENTSDGKGYSRATVSILNGAVPILLPLSCMLLKRITPRCDLLQPVCLEGVA